MKPSLFSANSCTTIIHAYAYDMVKAIHCLYRDHDQLAASNYFEYKRKENAILSVEDGNRIGMTIFLNDPNCKIQIRLVWKEHQRKKALVSVEALDTPLD